MGGRDSSLKGVYVGGRPLDNPLLLTYVGTRITKEALEDVAERPQLVTQVVQAENYGQGDLYLAG